LSADLTTIKEIKSENIIGPKYNAITKNLSVCVCSLAIDKADKEIIESNRASMKLKMEKSVTPCPPSKLFDSSLKKIKSPIVDTITVKTNVLRIELRTIILMSFEILSTIVLVILSLHCP
jgi:hypothetical protein